MSVISRESQRRAQKVGEKSSPDSQFTNKHISHICNVNGIIQTFIFSEQIWGDVEDYMRNVLPVPLMNEIFTLNRHPLKKDN